MPCNVRHLQRSPAPPSLFNPSPILVQHADRHNATQTPPRHALHLLHMPISHQMPITHAHPTPPPQSSQPHAHERRRQPQRAERHQPRREELLGVVEAAGHGDAQQRAQRWVLGEKEGKGGGEWREDGEGRRRWRGDGREGVGGGAVEGTGGSAGCQLQGPGMHPQTPPHHTHTHGNSAERTHPPNPPTQSTKPHTHRTPRGPAPPPPPRRPPWSARTGPG